MIFVITLFSAVITNKKFVSDMRLKCWQPADVFALKFASWYNYLR